MLLIVFVVYEADVPTGKPFTFHIYVGEGPPLLMFDVKVTDCPRHIVFPGFAVMLTVGVKIGLTIIVMLLLVAVGGVAHVALLVIVQVTTWPLASVVVE